jgi:hypothetical protein
MSRVIDTRDLFIAETLGALAPLTREELKLLIEPGSATERIVRETHLGRADLAAHLAAELADAALQSLQGHR